MDGFERFYTILLHQTQRMSVKFVTKLSKATKLTGLIPLNGSSWVSEDTTVHKKHTCLAIGSPGRVFVMFFDTDTDRQGWLNTLKGIVGNDTPKDTGQHVSIVAAASESSRMCIVTPYLFQTEDDSASSIVSSPHLKHAASTIGIPSKYLS